MTGRPAITVAVAGVTTDAGKTWLAAEMLAQFRSMGCRVSARKPVQSFEQGTATTDAHLLGAATGEAPTTVCPVHRWYPLAMAPPIAAQRLGLAPIALHDLLDELTWRGDAEVGVVETVGGVRSPLADDGDSAAFVHALAPDRVVLVADAGLGAINAVRLCVGALAPLAITVMLNRFDGRDAVHESNREWLAERDGLPVV
ncbi:MAG TPA: dethiobiotin synthase, partial [Acidimicrobiales bacterium]|nr:dethiobiotin synthase [Acidimicrobiales bacterium]